MKSGAGKGNVVDSGRGRERRVWSDQVPWLCTELRGDESFGAGADISTCCEASQNWRATCVLIQGRLTCSRTQTLSKTVKLMLILGKVRLGEFSPIRDAESSS